MQAILAPTVRSRPCPAAPRRRLPALRLALVLILAGAGAAGLAAGVRAQEPEGPASETPAPVRPNLFPPESGPPRDLRALFDPSPAGALQALTLSPPPAADEDRQSPALREIGRGLAAWYDLKHLTASGERFDAGALTAGHRTLPFGSEVKVVNLRNGRAVTVRITDRGPYTKGRVIDLSRAAARALDMTGVDRIVLYAPEAPDVTATGSVKADRRRAQR